MRLVEQNSQVTPIMPSSPTIALRSSAEKFCNIASMRSAEQRQASASVFGWNTLTPRSLNSRNSSRSLDKRRVDQLVVLGRRRARLGLDPFVVLGRIVERAFPAARRRDRDRRGASARASRAGTAPAGRRRATRRRSASRSGRRRAEPASESARSGRNKRGRRPAGPGPPARRRPGSATGRRRDRSVKAR